MIIDDNPIDQLITEHVLRLNDKSRDIIVMNSANEALAYLLLNVNAPEALPYRIFLDLDMPVMNGFDFLQHFKECVDEIKDGCSIVVVTASERREDLERIKLNPFVLKLIAKPLQRHSLVL
ncbi:response regulator [Pedobacter insulae]|nr:response regulator [Pedobacter insulae]